MRFLNVAVRCRRKLRHTIPHIVTASGLRYRYRFRFRLRHPKSGNTQLVAKRVTVDVPSGQMQYAGPNTPFEHVDIADVNRQETQSNSNYMQQTQQKRQVTPRDSN
jgi:hypothetical protein